MHELRPMIVGGDDLIKEQGGLVVMNTAVYKTNEKGVYYRIKAFTLKNEEMMLTFYYYLPSHNKDWQDPFHGSIDIEEVCILSIKKHFSALPVLEQIYARKQCWDYLEYHHYFFVNNIIPFSHIMPRQPKESRTWI